MIIENREKHCFGGLLNHFPIMVELSKRALLVIVILIVGPSIVLKHHLNQEPEVKTRHNSPKPKGKKTDDTHQNSELIENFKKSSSKDEPVKDDKLETEFKEKLSNIEDQKADLQNQLKDAENKQNDFFQKIKSLQAEVESKTAKLAESSTEISNLKKRVEKIDRSTYPSKADSKNCANNENFNLVYHHPTQPDYTGRNFYGLKNPEKFKIYTEYLDSKEVSFDDQIITPQLVTAVSENHFPEHVFSARITKQTLKKLESNMKVLIWDIGLNDDQVEFIKKYPDFYIYRKFDFSALEPENKEHLMTMTWKIIVWTKCIAEFGACAWMDANVSLRKSMMSSLKNDIYKHKRPYVYTIYASGIPSMQVTHPDMFSFFPSNMSFFQGRENGQMQSGGEIIFNTKELKHGVMKYALACALTPKCMHSDEVMNAKPSLFSKKCEDYSTRLEKFHARFYNCHRFDQSLMDILIRNYHGNDKEKWYMDPEVFICNREFWEPMRKELGETSNMSYEEIGGESYGMMKRQIYELIIAGYYKL